MIAIATGFLIAISLSLALIGSYKPPKNDIPFVILISREPDMIHPLFSKVGTSLLLFKAMFRGLVERDDQLKLRPILVDNIPTAENGLVRQLSDGKMEVTWRFKKGLKWSDGHPLTPSDLIFAHEVMTHPDVVSLALEKSDAKNIHSIKLMDDGYTIKVLWKRPYYNYHTAHFVLPRHSLESALKNDPGNFEKLFRPSPGNPNSHPYQRNPVVNGPYTLDQWKIGTYIVLKANPHYHKMAKTPKFAFKIVKDVNSLLINLIYGAGDACTTISPEQHIFLKNKYSDILNVHIIKGMGWMHMDMNLSKPQLQDSNVRKALLYGINRKLIAKTVSYSTYKLAHSWLPPKHYAYSPRLPKYPYDPKKAASLLRKAGWIPGKNHILMKNGREFRLTLITDSKNPIMPQLAGFIREDFRKLGIHIDVRTMPATVWWTRLTRRNYDLALYTWYMWPRVDGESYWASHNIPTEKNKHAGINFPGLKNSELDSIHKKLIGTIRTKDRLNLFQRHQEIWLQELPSLPLFVLSSLSVSRKTVLNWKPTGSAIPETWNCEDWEVISSDP